MKLLLEFHYLLLELGHAFAKRRQRAEDRRRLQPVERGNGRITGHLHPGLDRLGDAGLGRGNRAFPNRHVSRHAYLAGQRDVIFNARTPGNPHLTRKEHAAANRDAVGHLDQVIDLGTGADARFA